MRHPPDLMAAGTQWLTRRAVALQLGCSVSSVRRMEDVALHPIADGRGVVRFDPEEVRRLAEQRPGATVPPRRASHASDEVGRRGRLAARVFAMFAAGHSLRHIVVFAKVPPELVRQFYHEWHTTLEDGEWSRLSG